MGKSPRLSKTWSGPSRRASTLEGFNASKAPRFVFARAPHRRPNCCLAPARVILRAARKCRALSRRLGPQAAACGPPCFCFFGAIRAKSLRPRFLSSFVGFLDCMRRLAAAPEAQPSDDKMTRPNGAFRPLGPAPRTPRAGSWRARGQSRGIKAGQRARQSSPPSVKALKRCPCRSVRLDDACRRAR